MVPTAGRALLPFALLVGAVTASCASPLPSGFDGGLPQDGGGSLGPAACVDPALARFCRFPHETACSGWFEDVTVRDALAVACPRATRGHGAASGDVDSDGDTDLVVGCGGPEAPWLLRNDGGGVFAFDPGVRLPASLAVALVDLDGDGDLDFIGGVDRLRVLHNDGMGQFAEAWVEAAAPSGTDARELISVLPADVDRDGDLDLVVATPVRVLLAGPDGDYAPLVSPVVPLRANAWTLALASFDPARPLGVLVGDDQDVVDPGDAAAPIAGSHDFLLEFTQTALGVRVEDSSPRLGPALSRSSMGVLSADFDDDGLLDLWFSNIGRRHLLLRDPSGTFVEAADTFGLGFARVAGVSCLGPDPRECLNSSWSALRFDFDADGWHDHVIATDGSPSLAVRRTGPRSYAPAASPFGCQDVRSLVSGDFDGDGRPDLFATAIGGPDRLLRNVATGPRPGRLVHFVGRAPNTGAIGATGVIRRASGLAEPFLVGDGGRVLGFSVAPLHVVDRPGDPAHSLDLAWPDGSTSSFAFDPVTPGPLTLRQPE